MVRFLTKPSIVALAIPLLVLQGVAQQGGLIDHATPQQLAGISKDNSRHFGDDPDDGGPIAKDLSPSLDPSSVGVAMRKVADWQLARSQPYFDRIWTWSVLYSALWRPLIRWAMRSIAMLWRRWEKNLTGSSVPIYRTRTTRASGRLTSSFTC
jgi:hypothetical protein